MSRCLYAGKKAAFCIFSLPPKCQDEVETVASKITEIHDELSAASKGDAEFTINNTRLPEYDDEAVQLFFGAPTNASESVDDTRAIDLLHQFNERFETKLNEILGAAQLIINDYDELMAYLKVKGVP